MGGTDDDEEIQKVDDLAQMEWVNTFFSSAPTQEVVGTSQLGGAPSATQDYTQVEQTPVPEQGRRSTRQTIPPEPLTYSQHHTRGARLQSDVAGGEGASADASSLQVVAC